MRSLDDFPSFLELGEWTTRHIRPLFEIFRDENVAPALAFIIVAFASVLCVLFALNTAYILLQVRKRTRAVRRIKGKAEFAESMPQVERLMLRSKYLRHSWQKFRETLIEPTTEDVAQGRKVIRNTARPQDYFNTSEAGLRFPLYRAMPNLLVGIGLLLTFFGLVTALYFTTDAIRMAADLTASQSALRDLLYAASFKFYTSIAGLGGSIVLTIFIRYGTAAVESTFDALASALEAKLAFVTPESIAFDHYREAQEQTKNLRLFNTEIAISVGKRIEEALAATLPAFLAQAMAPIGRSLDEVANKLTSMNEGAIGEMAGSFADKLQGATGDQMRGMADTLAELKTSLEKTNQGLTQSGTSLAESVARSSQDIRDAVTTMTSALKQAGGDFAQRIAQAAVDAGEESHEKIVGAGSDLAQTISGMGQQLTCAVNAIEGGLMGAVREMQNIERSIGQHVAAMNQLSKATQNTEETMTRSAQSMRDAGVPLAETSRQMADASRRIADATASAERSILGAQAEIRDIGQLLHATMETTAQQWLNYDQRFRDVDESLGVVLERLIKNVQDNVNALETFVLRVDEKLSGAVDKLGGGIDELGEFAQSMEQLTAKLNGGGIDT